MPLERMDAFFDARVEGYDQHMLRDIAGASAFYPYTAALLPQGKADILDLGCGTGLELDEYLRLAPNARITCVDLSRGMTELLLAKHPQSDIQIVLGSYFDVPLGENCFDGAVSVESLHHFTMERKLPLYQKLYAALRPGGIYVETDYAAADDADEARMFSENARIRREQGIPEEAFYHFDTPLTCAHTLALLREAGFENVQCLRVWENTVCIRAEKCGQTANNP